MQEKSATAAVLEGRHFEPGERGVLINRGVARKLGLRPGDDMVALGTTSDGRLNGVKLRVTGIYSIKGLEEWGSCYADLASVQELLDVPDQAGLVVLRLADAGRESDSVRDRLNTAFRTTGENAVAFTWKDMGGPFIGGMLVTSFVATIMNFMLGVSVLAALMPSLAAARQKPAEALRYV